MARKPWKDLSPDYKKRLQRNGITARNHGVANLIVARGHQPYRPTGSIDPAFIDTFLREPPPLEQLRTLGEKFTRPSWIPDYVAVDAAAALSQLPSPDKWESVELTPRDDGQAWTMIVHLKHGAYDREILIPGGGGPGTGARDVLQLLTDLQIGNTPKQRKRRSDAAAALFFEVLGSDDETLEREVGRKFGPGSRWHYTDDHATALCNPKIELDVFKPVEELTLDDLVGHPRCRRCMKLVDGQ